MSFNDELFHGAERATSTTPTTPKVVQLSEFTNPEGGELKSPTSPDFDDATHEAAVQRLIESYDHWHVTEHARSTKALYVVAAGAYDFFWRAVDRDTEKPTRDRMWKAIHTKLAARDIRRSRDEKKPSTILKTVFGFKDRGRVSNFSKVFDLARKTGIKPDAFVDWLTDQGGLQKLRLSTTKAGAGKPTQKQKADMGRDALPDHPLMTVKVDHTQMPFGQADQDKKVLLIAEYDGQGNLNLFGVVRDSASALKAAYAAFGKAQP